MNKAILEAPAIGEKFFDREKELSEIINSILRGEHLVIIGYRKVGKTSIIFKVADELRKKGFLFVYTYIPESTNVELIAREFMNDVLSSLAGESGVLSSQKALKIAIKKYPKIASEILSFSELKCDESFFRDGILLLDNALEKIEKKVIIAFDEFQNVASASLGILDYLRQALWRAKRIVLILCGSMIRMIDNILSRPSMPQGLKRIRITPFDFSTAREFIISLSRKTIPETIMAFMYSITGGTPFHLKVLLQRINSMEIEKISWWSIRKILVEELMNDSGVLYNYYMAIETKLESLSAVYLEILYAIATGRRKLSEISRLMNKEPQEINYYVRRLREMEIIDDNNVIIDEMFEMWLGVAWPIIRKAPIPELEKRRKIFLQAIGKVIEQYKNMLGLAVETMIYELVKKMHGEKILGEKMPNPKQILRNVTIDNKEIDILALKNNTAWIIEISTSPISKKDIREFEEKTKLLRGYNIKGKILVALSTMSHEAIKQALQLGIKIWTREKIRKIMRYYKIPITPILF
ncbi:MAG: ATP-binding protein [Candidatus Njordarchaeota archaeon]